MDCNITLPVEDFVNIPDNTWFTWSAPDGMAENDLMNGRWPRDLYCKLVGNHCFCVRTRSTFIIEGGPNYVFRIPNGSNISFSVEYRGDSDV